MAENDLLNISCKMYYLTIPWTKKGHQNVRMLVCLGISLEIEVLFGMWGLIAHFRDVDAPASYQLREGCINSP